MTKKLTKNIRENDRPIPDFDKSEKHKYVVETNFMDMLWKPSKAFLTVGLWAVVKKGLTWFFFLKSWVGEVKGSK